MRRRFAMAWRVFAALALTMPLFLGAQQKAPLEALSDEMQGKMLSFEKVEGTGRLADCSTADVSILDGLAANQGVYTQYIYNATYRWATIPYGNGTETCIFLQMPEKRGLSREDARMLLSAHHRQFEIPADTQAPTSPTSDKVHWQTDDQFYLDEHGNPVGKKKR